jgi:hypothetical protein
LPFCAASAAATAFSRFWNRRRERYQLLARRKHSDFRPGQTARKLREERGYGLNGFERFERFER